MDITLASIAAARAAVAGLSDSICSRLVCSTGPYLSVRMAPRAIARSFIVSEMSKWTHDALRCFPNDSVG